MATLNEIPQDWEDLTPEEGHGPSDYKVELPVFEGPLDLLLHLIRKHEIDVFDIPISLITEKYLQYLEWMRVLNVDIASDFLVMAATLAHIKSKMLLPPDEVQDEEGEEEADPRDELVRRLLEYQRYKEVADELRDHPVLFRDVFPGGTRTPEAEADRPFNEVSVFRLIEAFDRVLKNSKSKLTHEVTGDRVSIADRINELVDLLKNGQDFVFEELFSDVRTRAMLVATFLAILEMARLRMIRVHQADGSEVIHVRSLLTEVNPEEILADVKLEI